MPLVPSSSTRSDHLHLLPRSLPLLLSRRLEGYFQLPLRGGSSGSPRAFVDGVARNFSPSSLVESPQIVTPQTQGTTSQNVRTAISSFSSAINSIHIDRVENRFLLAGGNDAIVSVYDLSKWGSEEYLSRTSSLSSTTLSISSSTKKRTSSRHKPIASSQRELPRAIFTESESQMAGIEIPSGHASPISKVQWYPVDSGAFLSSSKDGCLLIWDTDSMTPVAQCLPFADTNGGIATFHLSNLRNYSAVVASMQDPALKLFDIRSGASSHTLLGHANPGVSSVQWAPQNDVILASGGLDGTVWLWDIRKAGSRASLAILDQDRTHPPARPRPFRADYSHLPKPSSAAAAAANLTGDNMARPSAAATGSMSHRKRLSSRTATEAGVPVELAPNNYRNTENSTASSHNGPISALSFVEHDGGNHLVSASQDGNIHIWDLRGNGHLLPLRFLAPGHQPAIQRNRTRVPMLLTSFGKNDTAATSSVLSSPGACWVGNGSKLLGYSLDRGGSPHKVLQGHLQAITAIDVIEAKMQLLTAGKDGMILTWGKPEHGNYRKRKVDHDCW